MSHEYPLTVQVGRERLVLLVPAVDEQDARARITAAWACGEFVTYQVADGGPPVTIRWSKIAMVRFGP